MILNTEVLWSKALTDNNVRGIIHWLRSVCTEGEGDAGDRLVSFNCWLQRSADLTKKELLMHCFSRCKGLWMFLDEKSFTVVHKLVVKLKNLLSLVQLEKTHNGSHSKHGVPCSVCTLVSTASDKWGCWNQDHHAISLHILLGRLVQWWAMTGLLPKHAEAHELKRISQMWREMVHKHRRTCVELSSYAEDTYRWSSLIQGMVAHLAKKHGPIWVSEDCAYQIYPPPSLQALLQLVLVPNINIDTVKAIIIYFILDVSNFLQCKDNLLQSFCHAFNIPPTFSQQIYGFWLLDHGLVSDSMDVLLGPRACPPPVSWHHCAVLRTLLRRRENQAALKYLYSITPAMENIHDIKLCVDVLIQNNCVSEAWMMLRGYQTEDNSLFKHFFQSCENRGICSEVLATLCKDIDHLSLVDRQNVQSNKVNILNQEAPGQYPKKAETGQTPRPLSAWLYQSHVDDPLSSGDFIRILRKSISEICPQPNVMRREVELPKYLKNSAYNSLSSQTSHLVVSTPSVDIHSELKNPVEEEETEEGHHLLPEVEMYESLPVFTSASTSPDLVESIGSFTSTCSSPSVSCDPPPTQDTYILFKNSSSVPEDGKSHIPDADKTPNPVIMTLCCPDLTLTLEGASEAVSFNSLSRESVGGIEDILTRAIPEDISHSAGTDTVEAAQAERRLMSTLNLHPHYYSNEDNQAVSSAVEIPAESHNLLSPNYEKVAYHKSVAEAVTIKPKNLSDGWVFPATEQKAECLHLQYSVDAEASGSSSFLELKPLRRVLSLPRGEECLERFCCDSEEAVDQPEILTSRALTDTMHDLLTHPHQADPLSDDPYQPYSITSLKSSVIEVELSPIQHSSRSHQHQFPTGSLLPSRSGPIRTQQFNRSQQTRHRSSSDSRVTTTKEAVCFRTTSDRVGHCKLGSWWKQALETRRASAGLIPALEQVSLLTQEKRASPVPQTPYAHGLLSFLDSPSNPAAKKRAIKQDSMDVLLGPRACPPPVSWHHCAVLRTLLRRRENQAALKYLYSITPAMENIHDIKLCVDVLIQNKQ